MSSHRENHGGPRRLAPAAWLNTLTWAPVLPSGARSLPWAMVFPVGAVSRPTRRHWHATPHCARKLDWSPSSNRRCSWSGSHSLKRCGEVTEEVLRAVFNHTLLATGVAGGHDPQTQHGAAGIDLPPTGIGQRRGRRHGNLSLAVRPRCRSGNCLLVGRPIR